MAGLLDLFQPATPDPLGRVLGASYDEGDQRWAGISKALGAASDAFLHPAQGTGGGIAGAIGQLGGAMGKAGTAYGEGKTDYLYTAAKNEIAKREIERKKRLEDQEIAQDQSMVDLIATLSPEERAWARANPQEWYKQVIEQKYAPADAANNRASTQATKVFNEKTRQWEDYQLYSGGGAKQVDYGEGKTAMPPGEATVRGKEFSSFDKQQDAAYTSVTNIAQASQAIGGLRDELATDPEWATSWGGYALKDLPGTKAMGVRKRIEQLDSLAFFSNIQEMQGYGALSNAEGGRVAAARSRVDQATDLPTLVQALDDYERVIGDIFARNQRIMDTQDWKEMAKIRQENAKGLTFKKSRVPPFPTEAGMTQDEWDDFSNEKKREFYDAQGWAY